MKVVADFDIGDLAVLCVHVGWFIFVVQWFCVE